MECHRCEHRAEVAAGAFAAKPFDETPCARCELKENSQHTIEFDEGRRDERVTNSVSGAHGLRDAALTGLVSAPPDSGDVQLPLSVMHELVTTLLELPPIARDTLCWRFCGFKYGDIAAIQGVTVAAVEMRQRRVLRKYPALGALFPVKVAKQKRRRPHRRKSDACG